MSFEALNPKPFLLKLTGQRISVKLKWGLEYRGTLVSHDNYMNLHLSQAEEYLDGAFKGQLGEIFIRCNNVLYMKEADDKPKNGEEGEEGQEQ